MEIHFLPHAPALDASMIWKSLVTEMNVSQESLDYSDLRHDGYEEDSRS